MQNVSIMRNANRIMRDEPHHRLARIREMRGYASATDAALENGWTVPTYICHENGSRGMKRDVVEKYAKAFECSPQWLAYGTGDISGGYATGDKAESAQSGNIPQKAVAARKIRKIQWGSFIASQDYTAMINQTTDYTIAPKGTPKGKKLFSMEIADASMVCPDGSEPSWNVGDEVLFSLGDKGAPGDFVLAIAPGEPEELLRKRVRGGRDQDGREIIKLVALNPAYEPVQIIDGVSGEIIARAFKHIRNV